MKLLISALVVLGSVCAFAGNGRWKPSFQKEYENQWAVVTRTDKSWSNGHLVSTSSENLVRLKTSGGSVKEFELDDVQSVELVTPTVTIYHKSDSGYLAKIWDGKKTGLYASLVESIYQKRPLGRIPPDLDLNTHRFTLGDTLLCIAARADSTEAIESLIQAGAKPEELCAFAVPVVVVAAMHKNNKGIIALVENGADASAFSTVRTIEGIVKEHTALMILARTDSDTDEKTLEALISHGARPEVRSPYHQRSAMGIAAGHGAVRNLRLFLKVCDAEAISESGALSEAVRNLQVEAVEELVGRKAKDADLGLALSTAKKEVEEYAALLAELDGLKEGTFAFRVAVERYGNNPPNQKELDKMRERFAQIEQLILP